MFHGRKRSTLAIARAAAARRLLSIALGVRASLAAALMVMLLLPMLCGCKGIAPSNNRNWSPDQEKLPTVEFDRDKITFRNVRYCKYLTADNYLPHYEDRTYSLGGVQTVDFIVVPFPNMPAMAHTMLSFGFDNGEYLCISVEIRKEKGESYDPARGLANGYEIMYVAGDERDLIKLRTHHRLDEVYLYRTRATPEQARAMLLSIAARMNHLAKEPEFYNTLVNNCTTNIIEHINQIQPGILPLDARMLLPGFTARMAYDLGLLVDYGCFEETTRRALINARAYQASDEEFSQAIRRL